jgi:hypothetical protein
MYLQKYPGKVFQGSDRHYFFRMITVLLNIKKRRALYRNFVFLAGNVANVLTDENISQQKDI